MTRSNYRAGAIRRDELEDDIAFLRTRDKQLPEPAGFLDAYRSWKRLAKREIRLASAGGGSNPEPVTDRAADTPPTETRLSAPRDSIEDPRLKDKIRLELLKANTFYWKARSLGRAVPRETSLVVSDRPAGFLCRLHRTVHPEGPCLEISQIANELKLDVNLVGRHGEGG